MCLFCKSIFHVNYFCVLLHGIIYWIIHEVSNVVELQKNHPLCIFLKMT